MLPSNWANLLDKFFKTLCLKAYKNQVYFVCIILPEPGIGKPETPRRKHRQIKIGGMIPLKELLPVTVYSWSMFAYRMKKKFPTYIHQSAKSTRIYTLVRGKGIGRLKLNPADLIII